MHRSAIKRGTTVSKSLSKRASNEDLHIDQRKLFPLEQQKEEEILKSIEIFKEEIKKDMEIKR